MKTCAAVLVLAICITQVFSSVPRACRRNDCPKYTVLQTKDGYELRQYNSTYWAMTGMARESEMWGDRSKSSQSFWKLFNYIQGANKQGRKLPMTSPVLITHQKNNIQMGFMMPLNVGAAGPEPTDSDVTLVTLPPFQVYVRSFGGWAYGWFNNRNYYKIELKYLKAALKRDGITYTEDKFYTAGYDSPMTMFGRRNEVMIPKN